MNVPYRWWRTSPRILEPAWRSYAAIAAAVLVAVSDLMLMVYGVLVEMSGNGSSDHSLCPWVARLGFLAGPFGFLATLPGNGKLRWPGCALSALMAIFWLIAGLAA